MVALINILLSAFNGVYVLTHHVCVIYIFFHFLRRLISPSLYWAQEWTQSFMHAQQSFSQLSYSPSPNLAFLRLNFVLKLKATHSIIPALRRIKLEAMALHPGMEYITIPFLKNMN